MKSKIDDPPKKDDILKKLIPEKISPCALHTGKDGVCMRESTLSLIEKALDVESEKTPEQTSRIQTVKEKLGCSVDGPDGEICVLQKMKGKIGQLADSEIMYSYKNDGPTDAKLATNIDLDAQMQQWMLMFKDFYAYNFNMRNYHEYSFKDGRVLNKPDTLATISFYDLFKQGFRCAGCIINTDYYQNAGIHWMCLFVDTRDSQNNSQSSKQNPTYSVEFFNSSGNAPTSEWIDWMVRTKADIEHLINEGSLAPKTIEVVKSSSIRHQRSKSECGFYSLFYAWARLNRVGWKYFLAKPIPDSLMFEFRQHLFRGEVCTEKFDWASFKNKVKVGWE